MQTRSSEDPWQRSPHTSVADRRTQVRQEANFTLIRYVVVLGLGTGCRAELIDESHSGIGILVDDIDSSVLVGDVIELIYSGRRRAGEIRHITAKAEGYHVGIHWME